MINFETNVFYNIDDLIKLVMNKEEREAIYMVYVPKDTDHLCPGMQVYIGDGPDFDDDDNEVFPASIKILGLDHGYMQEHFEDVVDLAYKQKPTASIEEVIQCLNHYSHYDDFLDLN